MQGQLRGMDALVSRRTNCANEDDAQHGSGCNQRGTFDCIILRYFTLSSDKPVARNEREAYLGIYCRIAVWGQAGVLLKVEWSPESKRCTIVTMNNKMLAATFIYTMAFDFVVLLLTGWKLVVRSPARLSFFTSSWVGNIRPSGLSQLVFADGLFYFLVTFLVNMTATIFMLLNLNPVMSIVANVPAATASTVFACRAVRRLSKYGTTEHESRTEDTNPRPPLFATVRLQARSNQSVADRIHVNMETFRSPPPFPRYPTDTVFWLSLDSRDDPSKNGGVEGLAEMPFIKMAFPKDWLCLYPCCDSLILPTYKRSVFCFPTRLRGLCPCKLALHA
ncbi:hypothetical protein ARMGADRAFT_1029454 [Armillaria gallica]|uniref:Uncharacterized protein n=1 Tax=Armillaria gallica TaxID=47427 RepID=A0A2H3DGH0_ARMGA|nr:hypothetical protein ARMGADRAFT_1029454 [Armillaria gallica]